MKTIEEWVEIIWYENKMATLGDAIQTIRNEAFDAAIATIKSHEIYVDAYDQTLGQAVKAIEELKEKGNENTSMPKL